MGLSVLLFSVLLLLIFFKQDAIVNSQIDQLNKTYNGHVAVGDVHLAPFANFPYVSLKIDDVRIHESKKDSAAVIIDVADIYMGFNFWDVVRGNYSIQSLIVEDGFFDLVLHTDGRTNVENALSISSEGEGGEAIDIHLQKIELKKIDIHQREEATNLDIETFIYWANGGFNTRDKQIGAHIDTEFELNIITDGDTSYLNHKHFEFHTDLRFDESNGLLVFKPSGLRMEHGDFELEGSLDTKNDMSLDIELKGTKPSFDMLIAFAPTELIPVLESYKNEGNIYFNAIVQGPIANGAQPFIDAQFGANEAYLENLNVNKRIDNLGFSGHFTNGEKRKLSTTVFSITDISASLDKGKFVGFLEVENFEEPEIDMSLDADFDIDFIVDFLNFKEVEDAKGSIEMKFKFHDIVDLESPEKVLDELNQAYYTELRIQDLSFLSEELPMPIDEMDVHLKMNGKEAQLDEFYLKMGESDLSMTAVLSDFPAIVHHRETDVDVHMEMESKVLDLAELTSFSAEDSTGLNERLENLSLAFSFKALGNAFTEFTHLPIGEFFIDDFHVDLEHYPHSLHDFHVDILVEEEDLKIVDFTGAIDDSDFEFNGLVHNYGFWMQHELNGDVDLDVSLKSDKLRFEDLFAYQGENYVPEDYRHEEINGLDINVQTSMHYVDSRLQSIDLKLNKFEGKMHIHPLRFEDFSGQFHYEDDHLRLQDFKGQMGKTDFDIDMTYYLGDESEKRKKDNTFSLTSTYIDFDALTNFNMNPPEDESATNEVGTKSTEDLPEHAEAFNLYELPFTDMQFNVEVGHFIYHRLDLQNVSGQLRSTENHFIYLDTLSLDAAGGHIAMSGYFNGSDAQHIYLKPNLKLSQVDLDKLLFKFENFGQEVLVSENIHGKLNAHIWGDIRVYPDMLPDLDQSEVHLDLEVLNGRLENYDPILMLSEYFGDKDLTSIKFDTLQNHMDITQGTITVPNMTIESTLGHMDISGTQDMNNNIDFYMRIPWSLVKQAARNKIFGTKERDETMEDEIVEVDPKKKTRYLNVNVSGTFDDYNVRMKKAKKRK